MALPMLMIVMWKASLGGMACYIAYDLISTSNQIKQDIADEQLDREVDSLLRK